MSTKRAQFPLGLGLGLGLAVAFFTTVFLGGVRPAQAAKCPNLVIVLDKSGSMTSSPSGGSAPPGGSKWDLAKIAIKSLLKTYDGQLPIGLALFASDSGCGAARLDIPPDYDTAAKISTLIDSRQPDSSTPTSEAIVAMSKEPVLHDPSRSQYMLLLTDGEPSCASGEPTTSVNAIAAAHMQSPPITTFVVGFGALPASAASAMDQMAVAGGAPSVGTPRKYYTAEDLPSLKAALAKILAVVTGEFASACDDSCYAADIGCKAPGETCIRGSCRQNPCAGVTCDAGQYCYTDGVSPARCVAACRSACPRYTRCELGRCVESACPTACAAGLVCNNDTGRCEPDPLCPSSPTPLQKCHSPSLCQRGECVDDPCRFISCPAGTRCLPGSGSCEWAPPAASMDMGASGKTEGEVWHNGGCAVPPQGPGGARGPGDLSRPGRAEQAGPSGPAGLAALALAAGLFVLALGIKEYRQTMLKPYRVIYRVVGSQVVIYLIVVS